MKNAELARLFTDFAGLLEAETENPFRFRAYRKVAKMLEELDEDIEVVATQDRLLDLPGVGGAIADKIVEYLDTGKVQRYEEARERAQSR